MKRRVEPRRGEEKSEAVRKLERKLSKSEGEQRANGAGWLASEM